MSTERIQKFLSGLGYGSRREIEEWITDGRLEVNGEAASIGQKIGESDAVKLDGKRLSLKAGNEPLRVLLYKKRTGEMVTREDPEGRRTVFRKLPELETGRWIAVGRLDVNTSGLLLMTNHGELARRLMHPSFEQRREYAVRALGEVGEDTFQKLRDGVMLEDGEASFESIRFGDNEVDDDEADGEGGATRANKWFIVTISEGRHREVRRLFESQGLIVNRLIRTAYGPIKLGGGIKSGSYREATAEELRKLLDAVNLDEKEMKPERVRESHRTKSDYTAHREPTAEATPGRGDSKTAKRNEAKARRAAREEGGRWVKASAAERRAVDRVERRDARFGTSRDEPTYRVRDKAEAPERADAPGPWGAKKSATRVEVDAVRDEAPQQFKAKGFGARSERSYQERGDHAPAAPTRRYRDDAGEKRPYPPREGFAARKPRENFAARKPVDGAATRKPWAGKGEDERPSRWASDKPRFSRPDKPSVSKPYVRKGEKPAFERSDKPAFARGDKPAFSRSEKPAFSRSDKPAFARSDKSASPRGEKPAYARSDKPSFRKDERPAFRPRGDDSAPRFKPRGERPAAAAKPPRAPRTTERFVVKDGAATRPGKPRLGLGRKRDDDQP
jgi:pseudouridine synthase